MNQPITKPNTKTVAQLRLRFLLTAVLYIVATMLGYAALQDQPTPQATHWLGWTLFGMLCHIVILWWGLPHNHRKTENRLLPTLGFGNAITLTRGLLVALVAGFLFSPLPTDQLLSWTPAILYTVAILLDYLDGFVARLTNHSTQLGEMLDMEFDGLGILIAIAIAIQYGNLPPWYLILGLGRQLFILGLWIRTRLGKPNFDMTKSNNRRLIAGVQMGFISVMLWPILAPPFTTLACILFSVPLAASFARDWLVVSGQFDPHSTSYQRWHSWGKNVLESSAPLLLRFVAVVAFAILWHRSNVPLSDTWDTYHKLTNLSAITAVLFALHWITPLAAFALLLGIISRTSALILIAFVALSVLVSGMGWEEVVLLTSTSWILQFSGGMLALWPIEEKLLGKRAGED